MMFTLAVKDKISRDLLVPITSTDLASGALVNGRFTAFINASNITTGTTTDTTNPCPTFTPNSTGIALQQFVNGGGIYIGNNSNGYNTARCVLTGVAPATIPQLLTPGSTFDATIDTTNPVAWGFDLGGWIYRDSSGNPVWNGDTLGFGAKAVVSYAAGTATNPGHYGYQTNAAGLAGRPAVIDAANGSGHAILLGFDPFYRAWKEQDERLVLNAALYPVGNEIAPAVTSVSVDAPVFGTVPPAAAPVASAKSLTTHTKSAGVAEPAADRDVRIAVKRADGAKLKAAVKAAKLSKSVKRKLRYRTTKTSVTLVVKGARTSNEHARRAWVSRIQVALSHRKVKPIYGVV